MDLLEFARLRPLYEQPGVFHDVTPERVVTTMPAFPIAGPNAVRRVRVPAARVDSLAEEVEATFATAGLPFVWELDDATEPPDLSRRLEARGYRVDGELACLALDLRSPAGAALAARAHPAGVSVEDGLASFEAFAAGEAIGREAFGGTGPPAELAGQRYRDALAGPRLAVLARLEGEPAGIGWAVTLPGGTHLNGGAVAPRFRGRGVYGAVLAARARAAAELSSPGLTTLARPSTSEPILRRLGFVEAGRLRHLRRD